MDTVSYAVTLSSSESSSESSSDDDDVDEKAAAEEAVLEVEVTDDPDSSGSSGLKRGRPEKVTLRACYGL